MSETEFRGMLREQRGPACLLLMQALVDAWMNDGPEEVVRCLSLWAEKRLDLGDEDALTELAQGCGLVEEDDQRTDLGPLQA